MNLRIFESKDELVAAHLETAANQRESSVGVAVNGFDDPSDQLVALIRELAEWVGAESKCCPFFDFHIDVEREGKLLCLRLTGEEGIKAFIRAEFGVEKTR